MSSLEELILNTAEPSSLGAKAFRSFITQPVRAHANDSGGTPTPI